MPRVSFSNTLHRPDALFQHLTAYLGRQGFVIQRQLEQNGVWYLRARKEGLLPSLMGYGQGLELFVAREGSTLQAITSFTLHPLQRVWLIAASVATFGLAWALYRQLTQEMHHRLAQEAAFFVGQAPGDDFLGGSPHDREMASRARNQEGQRYEEISRMLEAEKANAPYHGFGL